MRWNGYMVDDDVGDEPDPHTKCVECGTTEHTHIDHDGAWRCMAHLRIGHREEWPSVMDAAETPFADNH